MAILNVEDDAPSRFLRSRVLERAGFSVREASTAAEALAFALAQPPKLLLLDVALPDGDGFSVCEQLKTAHPDVAVVMITAIYQNAASRRDGYAVGADEYLLSPVAPERLVDTVSRFVTPGPAVSATPPATIVTDDHGRIVYVNAPAGRLLNLTPRGARDRSLLVYFDENRGRLAIRMERAVQGQIEQFTARLRPRDAKPFQVRVDVSSAPFERGGSLEWVLEPLVSQNRNEEHETLSSRRRPWRRKRHIAASPSFLPIRACINAATERGQTCRH